MLLLGDGITSNGSVTGAIVNNSALITNYGTAAILSNNISGTGSLSKIGGASLSVTGTNTFSGGTTISNGILELDGGGSLGTGAVVNNAALIGNNTTTIFGAVSGTGTLTVNATGYLTLAGNNSSFTGPTTINGAGTLQIGSGSTSGTLPGGALSNNAGTLAWDRSDSTTMAAPISFTGAFSQAGAGNVTLAAGANSVGTLNVGVNSSTGEVIVPAGGTLSVGNSGTSAS